MEKKTIIAIIMTSMLTATITTVINHYQFKVVNNRLDMLEDELHTLWAEQEAKLNDVSHISQEVNEIMYKMKGNDR